MTEIYYVKAIDNSRLVRAVDPARRRECRQLLLLASVVLLGALFYSWQHFQCIQLGYTIEGLKAQREQALELNRQLRLEAASLRDPMRIDAIASSELGLVVPSPPQRMRVAPVATGEPVVARAGQPVAGGATPIPNTH
jgi:cell division protein FtsL